MSTLFKTVLIALSAVLIAGACLTGVGLMALRSTASTFLARNVERQPAEVAAAAAEIAAIELPAGYHEQFSASFLGFRVASYVPEGFNGHLYLAAAPKALRLDPQALRDSAQQASGEPREIDTDLRVLREEQITIQDAPATLIMSEGQSSGGYTYREMTVFFEGKQGQSMVSYSAPVEHWDQAACDALLASLQ